MRRTFLWTAPPSACCPGAARARNRPNARPVMSVQGQGDSRAGETDPWKPAFAQQELFTRDYVRTGAYSRMGLLFRDRSQVRLAEKTLLQIKSAPPSPEDPTVLRLEQGRSWSQTNRTRSNLYLETPSATAAVRGTDWEVEVFEDGRALLTVLSGEVEFAKRPGQRHGGQERAGAGDSGAGASEAAHRQPAIVAEMTAHPGRLVLGGQRRTLTVMFTDLAGFTSMSEGIAPEAVAQILNEHLTLMTRIVLAHGGTIDKFIGDAVMAFGALPSTIRRTSLRGVQAAIEMQAEMERFRREPGRPDLHMRIGLNTGPVVVGNLGSKDRFAYTVIGDAVNLAARLEPPQPPLRHARLYGTQILLAEETAAAVRDAVARHVDRVRVKGRTQPVEIYTPENDAAMVEKTEAAIALYRDRDWEGAERAWRAVAELRPGDGLASEYLGRIELHRRHGVFADWDGPFALDHK